MHEDLSDETFAQRYEQVGHDLGFAAAEKLTLKIIVVVLVLSSIVLYSSLWLASQVDTTTTWERGLAMLVFLSVTVPSTFLSRQVVVRRLRRLEADLTRRQRQLDDERDHRLFEAQFSDALEMAGSEAETLRTIQRAFRSAAPAAHTSLMLADNSHAHLVVRADSSPDDAPTGCDVATPQDCPAARRARVHHFTDGDAINTCPKLADRSGGPCAAVCIPVSVMGRTIGIVHAVTPRSRPTDERGVRGLHVIANQAGARIGMLRVMAETELQAETDALTGLMNRRAFENAFRRLRNQTPHGNAVVAMADLDLFKAINDTHGHDTGDRALRVFSSSLRQCLRANDLLARHGGEEFTMVFPECDIAAATAVLERVREQLQIDIRDAGLPSFTASFGITPAFLSEDLEFLLSRADAAMFEAKQRGRDRIVSYTAADLDEHLLHLATTTTELGRSAGNPATRS